MQPAFRRKSSSSKFKQVMSSSQSNPPCAEPLNIKTFTSQAYDYIIIGGGTAGLVLANRLSEDSDVEVAVLEAGEERLNDIRILIPGLAPSLLGQEDYDWCLKTVPQPGLGGRVEDQPRGKVLGGSSAINYLMATYPSSENLDIWEKLGNENWNGKDIRPYFQKFQTFSHNPQAINKTKSLFGISDLRTYGDESGPIQTGYYRNVEDVEKDFVKTFNIVSHDKTSEVDPTNGTTKGAYPIPATYDTSTGTRSYSANGYYVPASNRGNLNLLTKAHVTKILFSDDKTATGVQFQYQGTLFNISTRGEVILCAGTFQSPQILELSGIGNPDVLIQHSISPIVENVAVGQNLQDHIMAVLPFQVAEAEESIYGNPEKAKAAIQEHIQSASGQLSRLIATNAFVSLSEILSKSGGSEAESPESVEGFLSSYLTENTESSKQDKLIRDLLAGPNSSAAQFTLLPSYLRPPVSAVMGSILPIIVVLMHPFSRGSVHIASSNPLDPPLIDPKYFSHPLDLEILARSLQYTEFAARHPPLSSHSKGGKYEKLFENLEKTKEFLIERAKTCYHPVGSCSMSPREEGGVVDSEFRVHGVQGLRVVDASIFPVEVEGNPITMIYAVAERAADILKARSV